MLMDRTHVPLPRAQLTTANQTGSYCQLVSLAGSKASWQVLMKCDKTAEVSLVQ